MPNTKIKSYQGMILSYDYNFHLCPTTFEVESGLIADEIMVIGKKLTNYIYKFTDKIKVNHSPAFRFKFSSKKYAKVIRKKY